MAGAFRGRDGVALPACRRFELADFRQRHRHSLHRVDSLLAVDQRLRQRPGPATIAHLGFRCRCEQPRQRADELESIREKPYRFDEAVARISIALEPDQRDRLSKPRFPDAWIRLDDVPVLTIRRVESLPAPQRIGQL